MMDTRRPLSLGRQWHKRLFIFLLFVSALLLFAPFSFWSPVYDPFFDALMDGGHMPLFMLLTLAVYFMPFDGGFCSGQARASSYLVAFLASVTELIQPLTGRSASLTDWINGLIGVAAAFGVILLWQRRASKTICCVFGAIVIVVLLLLELPALRQWQALSWQRRNFPLLADFESDMQFLLWKPHRKSFGSLEAVSFSNSSVSKPMPSMKVITKPGLWDGVTYNAGDLDWNGFATLSIEIFNPGERFSLHIRIDDNLDCSEYLSRFNRRLEIYPQWNTLHIPLSQISEGPEGRNLNLGSIRRMSLFTAKSEASREFYINKIYLE